MRHVGQFIKNCRLASMMLLLLFSSASFVFGQTTIHISTPAGALVDGSVGTAYSTVLTATGDLNGIAWQIVSGYALPPPLTLGQTTGIIGGMSEIPAISDAGQTYTFEVQVTNAHDAGNGITPDPPLTFSIHIARLPVDVMLVLDNSASMGCCYNQNPIDVTCETCATATDTRLKKLQAAFDKFIALGTAGATPYFHFGGTDPDRFGVTIFCGTVDNSHSTYVTTLTGLMGLDTYVQGLGTCGGTCTGGAVISAYQSMVSQTAKNHSMSLILFTDGEQNYNPMFTTTGAPVTFAPNATVNPYNPAAPDPPYGTWTGTVPSPAPTFDPTFKTTTPGITISTIGFELPAGPGNALLAALADPNAGAGGTTNITGTGAMANNMGFNFDDFSSFFNNAFVTLLNGSSPQLVGELQGNTVAGSNNFAFTVNDSVKKVTFIVSGNQSTAKLLNFRVLKDSVDVTSYGTMTNKPGFNLWNIDFPLRAYGGHAVTAGGHWVLQIGQTEANIGYDATCVVDDHALNYKCSTGGTTLFVVGDAIPLSVRLKNRGGKMRSAAAARVIVLVQHSSGDGGTALAQLPVAKEIIGQQAVVDPAYNNLGQIKHYTLLQTTPQYGQTLGPVVDTVTLTLVGDSIYTGSYTPKVTGPYKFTFLIHGKDSTIGDFYRSQTQSGVANLAHFDLAPGNIKIIDLKDSTTGQLNGYNITIIFKDSSGLLLGPAFNEAIQLTTNAGKFGKVVDNLDGSYTLTLTDIGNNTDPQIGININGHTYYNGTVSQLGSGSGSGSGGGGIFSHWWFWLILLIILIAIILALRKK